MAVAKRPLVGSTIAAWVDPAEARRLRNRIAGFDTTAELAAWINSDEASTIRWSDSRYEFLGFRLRFGTLEPEPFDHRAAAADVIVGLAQERRERARRAAIQRVRAMRAADYDHSEVCAVCPTATGDGFYCADHEAEQDAEIAALLGDGASA